LRKRWSVFKVNSNHYLLQHFEIVYKAFKFCLLKKESDFEVLRDDLQ